MGQKQKPRLDLSSLPREIRDAILGHLLNTTYRVDASPTVIGQPLNACIQTSPSASSTKIIEERLPPLPFTAIIRTDPQNGEQVSWSRQNGGPVLYTYELPPSRLAIITASKTLGEEAHQAMYRVGTFQFVVGTTLDPLRRNFSQWEPMKLVNNFEVVLDGIAAFQYRFNDSDVESARLVAITLIDQIASIDRIRDHCTIRIIYQDAPSLSSTMEALADTIARLTNFKTVVVKLDHRLSLDPSLDTVGVTLEPEVLAEIERQLDARAVPIYKRLDGLLGKSLGLAITKEMMMGSTA